MSADTTTELMQFDELVAAIEKHWHARPAEVQQLLKHARRMRAALAPFIKPRPWLTISDVEIGVLTDDQVARIVEAYDAPVQP